MKLHKICYSVAQYCSLLQITRFSEAHSIPLLILEIVGISFFFSTQEPALQCDYTVTLVALANLLITGVDNDQCELRVRSKKCIK